ncbi:MAG: hypothetical protein PF447_04500, partial [Spirochaetaceae bacterium]|nr:hypothetical protein [Spirochaetaceae bacterium]
IEQFQEHKVRLEVQPSFVDDQGQLVDLLPSQALGLPQRYHQPWGGRLQRIHVLPTEYGTIWGITGEILFELLKLVKH